MTNMMEKPKSNKSKSKYRHNRTQDHGDAGQRKGHIDQGYWENQWEQRGLINKDKAYLKEVIRDGLDDYYAQMSPSELEQEADRILREAEQPEAESASEHLNNDTYPTIAEVGGRTDKEIRASLARAATLDTFEEDDFGDYNGDSHIKIRNRTR
ncbi:MAG: hypothetical protein H6797_05720 [Candidatus Nomurabacteria bacterium]|nr:MAG: hypothetical protein H6797_05720 [Candidatus Nomurabacteria bacterium]